MTFRFYIFIFASILLLSSCYPEYKLAKSFIESKPDVSILILPGDYVFKKNLKKENIGDTIGMTSWEIDSARMTNSLFLKDISDSIFLETFINSMFIEFEKLGFTVYTENYLDTFLFFQKPAYILNIAQLEIEEYKKKFEDKGEVNGYVYHKSFDVDAVNFNSWFEISTLNTEKGGRKLFFASETIADIIHGYFTESLATGEIKYKYQTVNIDVDIIYRYAERLGQKYAGYTFDYIMNNYIANNYPSGSKRKYYMHYNRLNNTLDPTTDDRFELMEE